MECHDNVRRMVRTQWVARLSIKPHHGRDRLHGRKTQASVLPSISFAYHILDCYTRHSDSWLSRNRRRIAPKSSRRRRGPSQREGILERTCSVRRVKTYCFESFQISTSTVVVSSGKTTRCMRTRTETRSEVVADQLSAKAKSWRSNG